MKKISYIFLILFLAASWGCGESKQSMNTEFSSLSTCLSGIKKNTGLSLKIITDKPNEISGFLSNGEGFGCNKVSSGTKGTYVNGWYIVK